MPNYFITGVFKVPTFIDCPCYVMKDNPSIIGAPEDEQYGL